MNSQKIISTFYEDFKILNSAAELVSIRKHNNLHILGNGPSTAYEIIRLASGSHHVDVSGTSAIAFANIELNFYFFEPLGLINTSIHIENSADLTRHSLGISMHTLQVLILNKRRDIKAILANPQFPPNEYNFYHLVKGKCVILPPWFFVNEKDTLSKISGIKAFFSDPYIRNNLILNYCGSIIRQISLAAILGYHQVHIFGIEPSSRSYWYTKHLKLIEGKLVSDANPVLNEVLGNLLKIEQNDNLTHFANCFDADSIDNWPAFTRSILICLRLFSRYFPETKYCLHTQDPMILQMANEMLMINLISQDL
jgi:hypothetical protein